MVRVPEQVLERMGGRASITMADQVLPMGTADARVRAELPYADRPHDVSEEQCEQRASSEQQ